MKKSTLLAVFAALFFSYSQAAVIKGHVLDAKTKEGLLGAEVFVKDSSHLHDEAVVDGSYAIKHLHPGEYKLVVQFVGFEKQEKEIEIKDENEIISVDFSMKSSEVELNQVTVTGTYEKETDNYARNLEKNSDNVINVMSAKTIELLPDVTIGNVLQRLPGVTMEQSSSGEGRYAVIRGMDKRYNYTTIDGVKIPSPDNHNRYIPFDIFPTEVVGRVEVIKSLTPEMEGDAIGGAVNMVLKDAPDKFIFDANADIGYSQAVLDHKFTTFNSSVVQKQSPTEMYGPNYPASLSDFPLENYNYSQISPAPNVRAHFTVGTRLLNHKLGVIASVIHQNTFSVTKGLEIVPSKQPDNYPPNSLVFDDIEDVTYNTQQTRNAAHLKLDYEFNQNHKLNFYTVYFGYDIYRQRHISDTIANINVGEVDQHNETKVTHQSIQSNVLEGEHHFFNNIIKVDWKGVYSTAKSNNPDWGTLTTTGSDSSTVEYWQKFTRRWTNNTDKDKTGYLNLTYNLTLFGQKVELKAGGMYRNTTRDNNYNEYSLLFVPQQQAGSILDAQFQPINPVQPLYGTPQDPNNYSVTEDITGVYGQAKFNMGPRIQVIGGARNEYTSTSYVDNEPENIPGQHGSVSYTDLLPSIGIKYALNERMNLRGSYSASITRPGFFEITPYLITGDDYSEEGNPYLKRTQADNYDLRYEFFPAPSEQFFAGVFYKQLTNPIELAFAQNGKISAQYLQPQNFGNATNYGAEAVVTKYIRHFGISFNYTYTHSEITTTKAYYYKYPDPIVGNNTTIYINQTRPLQDQADHVGNVSFMYKNPKIGLDMVLSGIYTGKFIAYVSPDYDLDRWQMPVTRLDFSFEKRIGRKINLSVYGKVTNILNTAVTLRIYSPVPPSTTFPLPQQDDPANSTLVEKQQYGQGYLAGLRYKF